MMMKSQNRERIQMMSSQKLIAGWKESIDLPTLQLHNLIAKLDTGAAISTLHAIDIAYHEDLVSFSTVQDVHLTAPLLRMKKVTSSNGIAEVRPVIFAWLYINGMTWNIRLSLTDRSKMDHPILLGRQALKHQLLVDSKQTYLLSKKP